MPIAIVLAAAVLFGFLATTASQYLLLLAAGCAVLAVFAFMSPKTGLAILVFSMLLSPEIGLGALTRSRSVVVRYDDIMLVVIFFAWFARTAIFKNKPFITETPVQTPVLAYTILCVVSTALGLMRGDLNWKMSSLYVLKYVEYFLVFFMTVNIVESTEEAKKYLGYALVVAVIVTLYAYFYYFFSTGPEVRATAPFEAPLGQPGESEPAALGGYYLVIFGILLALLTEASGKLFWRAMALFAFMFPAFLVTFSRASYIGFAAMIASLFLLARKRRLLVAGILGAGIFAMMFVPSLMSKVVDRITMTYTGIYATQDIQLVGRDSLKLELSAAERIYSLRNVLFEKLPKHPVLGWGVTGVGLGDTQYALVLGELGLVGAMLSIWLLYRLFFTAGAVLRAYSDPVVRACALGFMLTLVGLLFQAIGVNTFITVRIMEPFWFMAAILGGLYVRARRAAAVPGKGPVSRLR